MRGSVIKTNTYVRRLLTFVPIIIALIAQPVLVVRSPIASAATTTITLVDEGFDAYEGTEATEPDGWDMIGTDDYTSAANSGLAIPGVAFNNDNDRATVSYSLASNQVSKSLSFWMRNVSGAGSSLVVDQLIGSDIVKTTIESITTDQTEETKTIQLEPQTNGITFTMQKNAGNIALDDVVITGEETSDTTKPTASLALDAINPTGYSVIAHDNEKLAVVTGNLYGSTGLIKSCSKSGIGIADYTLTCTIPNVLGDGTYSVRYNAKDASDNLSTTTTTAFILDHTKPSANIVYPAANQVLRAGAFTYQERPLTN